MHSFQKKRNRQKILYSWISISVITLAILFVGRAVWNAYQVFLLSNKNKEEATLELNELKERKAELEAELSRLKTNRGIEEELRQNFNAALPGEEVLIIVDDE